MFRKAVSDRGIPVIHSTPKMLHENERHAARLAESAIGEADPVSPDELCRRGLVGVYHCGRASYLLSRHCIGYDSQSRSRAVDVVLHRGRSAQADRPDNLSVHLDGKPATPRRYTRKRGNAGQKRRVALDKVEKVLSGDAE